MIADFFNIFALILSTLWLLSGFLKDNVNGLVKYNIKYTLSRACTYLFLVVLFIYAKQGNELFWNKLMQVVLWLMISEGNRISYNIRLSLLEIENSEKNNEENMKEE